MTKKNAHLRQENKRKDGSQQNETTISTTENVTASQNTLKCGSFDQDNTSVQVTLLAGKRLRANDMDVFFTEQDCTVTLTDGRRWNARFFRPIDHKESRTQIKQMKIILKLKKKSPGHWVDLQYIPGQSEVIPQKENNPQENKNTKSSDKKPSSTKHASVKKDLNEKSKAQSQSEKTETNKVCESNTDSKSRGLQNKKSTLAPQSEIKAEKEDEEEIIKIETSAAKLFMEEERFSKESSSVLDAGVALTEGPPDVRDLLGVEQDGDSPGEVETTDLPQKDGEYVLSHIKNDFHEKTVATGNDTIVVYVYVKEIVKETCELKIEGREVTFAFHTKDDKFHAMYADTTENTRFAWKITVVDELVTSQCQVKVTKSTAELTLRKKDPRRWTTLEAINTKEYAQTSTSWKPVKSTAKVTPLQSTTGAEVSNENQSNTVKEALSSQSKINLSETKNPFGSSQRIATENDSNQSASSVQADQRKGYVLGDSTKDNVQKPTCLVPPLRPPAEEIVVTPGFTGLDNLGNTCFMNSVLQVLANTTELKDYFLDGRFQRDLNYENVLGSGGKLAVEFATLLKVLWSGKRTSYAPSTLKKLVAQKKSMFSGFAQHDAQEYMSFLLDGLHEDVNRVKHKPYIEQVDSGGRPDEVVAEEFWSNHKKRNDSYLVDLFQGQYKSTLICPVCEKISVTFDAFMHLPVPLPKKHKFLPVYFLWRDPTKRPIKYLLKLPKDASVENLKDAIYTKTGVLPSNLRVFEAWKNHPHLFFSPGASLVNIQATDKIIVQEVLSEKLAGEPVKELVIIQRLIRPATAPTMCAYCQAQPKTKLKRCTRCYQIGYCNSQCQKDHWAYHKSSCKDEPRLVGMPFYISLPNSQLTFSRLYRIADCFARYSVDVFQPPQSDIPSSPTSPIETENKPVFRRDTMFSDDGEEEASSTARDNNPDQASMDTKPSKKAVETVTSNATPSNENVSESSETVNGSIEVQTDASEGVSGTSTVASGTKEIPSAPAEKARETEEGAADSSEVKMKQTRAVVGCQQEAEGPSLTFYMKPCSKEGSKRGLNTDTNLDHYLKDHGEEPLKLDGVRFLAMDWVNDERRRPYVLCQNKQDKELDCDDDDSVAQDLTADNKTSLQQCISLFMQPEVLSSEEAWYCPQCKEHREATKRLSLWRLPSYLGVQLKRFSYRNFLRCDKVDWMVEYPVRELDLSSYFSGPCSADQAPPMYDLTGVINHYGSILGGHYTAFARTPDPVDWRRSSLGWRLCDDSRVSTCSEERVVTHNAYLLFYRRRENLIVSPTSSLSTSVVPLTAVTAKSDHHAKNEEENNEENRLRVTLDNHQPIAMDTQEITLDLRRDKIVSAGVSGCSNGQTQDWWSMDVDQQSLKSVATMDSGFSQNTDGSGDMTNAGVSMETNGEDWQMPRPNVYTTGSRITGSGAIGGGQENSKFMTNHFQNKLESDEEENDTGCTYMDSVD